MAESMGDEYLFSMDHANRRAAKAKEDGSPDVGVDLISYNNLVLASTSVRRANRPNYHHPGSREIGIVNRTPVPIMTDGQWTEAAEPFLASQEPADILSNAIRQTRYMIHSTSEPALNTESPALKPRAFA